VTVKTRHIPLLDEMWWRTRDDFRGVEPLFAFDVPRAVENDDLTVRGFGEIVLDASIAQSEIDAMLDSFFFDE